MTSVQGALWRDTDAETAQQAAESVDVPARCKEVLRALAALGEATPWEIWVWLQNRAIPSPGWNCTQRRLVDLERRGLAARTGKTRPATTARQQEVWRATLELGDAAMVLGES